MPARLLLKYVKGAGAFLQHGQRKGAHVRILALSGSHERAAGVLLAVFAPHNPTKKYAIAAHVDLRLIGMSTGVAKDGLPLLDRLPEC